MSFVKLFARPLILDYLPQNFSCRSHLKMTNEEDGKVSFPPSKCYLVGGNTICIYRVQNSSFQHFPLNFAFYSYVCSGDKSIKMLRKASAPERPD